MSHQEKIERINASLNTSETWSQRWQIEREHNERLAAEADKVRTGVHSLRAKAVENYTSTHRYAEEARKAGDVRRAEMYEKICAGHLAQSRVLDDVLELMDAISREQ